MSVLSALPRRRLLLGALVIAGAACNSLPDTLGVKPPSASTILVSGTFPIPAGFTGAAGPMRRSAAVGTPTVVYVSVIPGAVLHGATMTVTNQTNAASLSLGLNNGGLDPVAVPAALGDTLILLLSDSAGSSTRQIAVVHPPMSPSVVRTQPPGGKTGVPLNTEIVAIFTEPMDPTTLDTATVGLWTGSTRIRGGVRPSPDRLTVTFTPDSLLRPNQSYVFTLGTGITSGANLPLAASVQSTFSTGTSTAPLSAMMVYGGINITVDSGGSLQLHAVGRDVTGNVVPNVPATYAPLHPAAALKTSVTFAGLVTGLASGIDTIVATAGGLSMPVAVTVVPHGALDPFAASTWDLIQQSAGYGCQAASVFFTDTPGLVWPFKGEQFELHLGCSGLSPGLLGVKVSDGLGATAQLPSGQFGDSGTVTLGDDAPPGYMSCIWSGVYRGGADPQITGTMSGSANFCQGPWRAVPATPVVSIVVATPQMTCSAGTSIVDFVALQDALGHPVHRVTLPTTSDDPSIAALNAGWYAGTDTTAVPGAEDMFLGSLVIRCNAAGQTQLHVTQDLGSATITVTVTP